MTDSESKDRRKKRRFPMQREMRFKVLREKSVLEVGTGKTLNIASGGIAFQIDHNLAPGAFIELSISWPVLLDNSCPMRLVTYGRLVRAEGGVCVCTVDKYEFRTQARVFKSAGSVRNDAVLERWADSFRKVPLRTSLAGA